MILLQANSITKHFGPEPVLQGVTFDVRPSEKIGLVGPNGAGKSTLLNILTGTLEPDAGEVQIHASARVGYLEQQPEFSADRTLWDEAMSALEHLVRLSHDAEQLAAQISLATKDADRRELIENYDRVQSELQRLDAFHLDHRVEQVLDGLGFQRSQYQQPMSTLSGGQQNRVMLAKLLLSGPDLMILDEPSNHLDIEATKWLEDFLASSTQTLLIVSHDRYFLDKVTNRTLELFRGTVDSYKGNFTAYTKQKAERLEVERRTYEKQRAEIEKLEDFVRRHHHGQKHAQAEDRRKKLERIDLVDPPREISVAPMGFPKVDRSGDVVLKVEHLSKAFDQPLFHDLSFDIERGQRWGILGGNGTGKTTLLRCIIGEVEPDSGSATIGHGVRIGYFDQHLSGVDSTAELADAIRPPHKEFIEQQRRDLLARFGIVGEMAFQRVGSLSGGERNRAALARLAAMDANFLVLDEPTNHLDLWARATLEKSLLEFDGTVLFVSHDRYFLNQVATHLLVLDGEGVRVVHGNYDVYVHMMESLGGSGAIASDKKDLRVADRGGKATVATKRPKVRRKRKFPYRKTVDIEADIMEVESEIEMLHEQLMQPEVLRDGRKVKETQTLIDQKKSDLATLYEHWEEAAELNG